MELFSFNHNYLSKGSRRLLVTSFIENIVNKQNTPFLWGNCPKKLPYTFISFKFLEKRSIFQRNGPFWALKSAKTIISCDEGAEI